MQRLRGCCITLPFLNSSNIYSLVEVKSIVCISKSSTKCYSSKNPFSILCTQSKINCTSSHKRRLNCSHIAIDGSTHVCETESSEYLNEGLREELIPKHVAIILDGSRRWLKAQGKPLDYEPFFKANTLFADLCIKWGVTTATSFIYSLKNLQRGKEANDFFFGQLQLYLERNLENFIRKKIKVTMIGERCALPKSLQDTIKKVEEATRKKDTKQQLELMLAICYSGTREIVEATRKISEKVKAGMIDPKAINEALLNEELWTSYAPHPDLLIRSGGRLRLSDYLMWQLSQTELYFTPRCAPEFAEVDFLEALRSFQERERTFGK